MEIERQLNNTSLSTALPQPFVETLYRWASLETLLIVWFFITPIASFYFRLPTDKSLITFDRAVIIGVGLVLFLRYRAALRRQQAAIQATKFEIVWALLAVLFLVSALVQSNNQGFALRIAIDAFVLPLVVFHAARYHVNLRGRERLLFFATIGLTVFLFGIGFTEYRTGVNLFAYKGSELLRDGELRVNGPFLNDSSYAIICLLVTLFLRLLPHWLSLKFDRTARLVYGFGLMAAVAATLLPLFRTVGVALVGCWLLIEVLLLFRPEKDTSGRFKDAALNLMRSKRVGIYAILAVVVFVAFTAWQEVNGGNSFARRLTSPRNVYGRLATWRTASRIALENPIFGVGLANYTDYFEQKFSDWREQRDMLADTRAAKAPHSNFLWIAAEFGAVGLSLYLLVYAYLLQLGYRIWKRATTASQAIAGGGFLILILAYTLPGLTLQSGAYWDLNLYFFFMLGLLSNKFLVSSS